MTSSKPTNGFSNSGVAVGVALAALPVWMLCTAAAAATDYCVTCTGPDATYVCEVQGMSGPAATGMHGQMLCIKDLAAAGGHKTCSVLRNAPGPCSGPLRIVAPPAAVDTAPAVAKSSVLHPVAKPATPAPANVLEAAGDGISNMVKKSWSCVASLFKDC